MAKEQLRQRDIVLHGTTVLHDADANLVQESQPDGAIVLKVDEPLTSPRLHVNLGEVAGVERFLACYRIDPYWMQPCVGNAVAQLPVDTQFALFQLPNGQFLVAVPLVSSPYRTSLKGQASKQGQNRLMAVLDSGTPRASASSALVVFLALGQDVHQLLRSSAIAVRQILGLGKLRTEKPTPDFIDLFGWCTWDAFYREVSQDAVTQGLESFRQGGVEPRLLILDDGWQTLTDFTNQGRLSGFEANDKFSSQLSHTVNVAKSDYKVERFLCWHTVHGYWSGADPQAFPDYGIRRVIRWYSPEVLSHAPHMNADFLDSYVDCPGLERLAAFYDDYHSALEQQGIDGVKVDNQASVEGLSHDVGGRVVGMLHTRRALEASTSKHFARRLINCMSCSSEMLYMTQDSNVTRTSTDFWPNKPETHGQHLYTNAMVSLWFGEFIHPDWDMFQSGHMAGAYHAAARAICGGPIYVSDKPGGQDFGLLRRLVMPDGHIPRALDPARPTLDCLFHDPTQGKLLLKLYNRNIAGYVLGAFNARYSPTSSRPIHGTIGPRDIPTLNETLMTDRAERDLMKRWRAATQFALYAVNADKLEAIAPTASHPVQLDSLGAELYALVPICNDVAVIGVLGYLNPGGTIVSYQSAPDNIHLQLACAGTLLVFANRAPKAVQAGTQTLKYSFNAPNHRLEVQVPNSAKGELTIELSQARDGEA